MKKIYGLIISLLLSQLAIANGEKNGFVTEGNGIRNSVIGQVNGESTLFMSDSDSSVASYTLIGKKRWSYQLDESAVIFEIGAHDLDNDGSDELLVASANGSIYNFNSDGKLRWQYRPETKVRFSEIAVVKNHNKVQIFAGGNDLKLYELTTDGQLVGTTKLSGVVRSLAAGNFTSPNKQSLLVITYARSDKWTWDFFGYLDPKTKKVLKKVDGKSIKAMKTKMITDLQVIDIDGDNLDDILLFASGKAQGNEPGVVVGLNNQLKMNYRYVVPKQDKQLYAHVYGTSLQPLKDQVAFVFGSIFYVTDLKGNLIAKTGKPYKGNVFNGLTFDANSQQLFGDGLIGGDNSFYRFDLDKKNWWETRHQWQGRAAKVEENLQTLYQQALNFEMPSYQKKSETPWVMITSQKINNDVKKLKGNDVQVIKQETWTEKYDRGHIVKAIGKEALRKDKRKPYNSTRKQLVDKAKKYEKIKQPFTIWAGHGGDPFYMHIETMEAIAKVAPKMFHGFVFAEMANTEDLRFHYFVEEVMPRLAKALRKHGRAKIYFRYKAMFWATTSHLEPWKELFFSRKYRDIIVPATEDTTSRTQDINLAGRVGMLKAGYIDDFALRLVEDNPTSWRPLSGGGQRSISPYLRSAVIRAAYGAKSGIISGLQYQEQPGLNVLYALMKSGVLPQVNTNDILSIGAWHLIDDIDKQYVHHAEVSHHMVREIMNDDQAFLSTAHISWAGASLPKHDYSKVALGIDYRWLNFVPPMPNGMVPIVPIEYKTELANKGIPYIVSDVNHIINNGQKLTATSQLKVLQTKVAQGAHQMPVRVEGSAWSAIKLDDTHIRLILIDQGYVTPQKRTAKISLQNISAKSITDILSKKTIKPAKQFELTVPAGSVRFIDIELVNSL